ncbi:1235_t:CDS:1, partial [Racocetra fulgida]
ERNNQSSFEPLPNPNPNDKETTSVSLSELAEFYDATCTTTVAGSSKNPNIAGTISDKNVYVNQTNIN